MNKVDGRGKMFYLDQCSSRECRISEEIDINIKQQQQRFLREEEELESFINSSEYQEVRNPSASTTRNSDQLSSTYILNYEKEMEEKEKLT